MSIASPPSRPRLTVAMIARNEQADLPATLASVRDIADELLVVDTGSTDATLDIARRHQARTIEHIWQHDFSAARNAGLAAARGDWIFWLDAGERLMPDQARALRSFVDTANRRTAWWVQIEVPPALDSGAAERVARLRLLPNHAGIQFAGRLRETPRASIAAAGLSLELAPIVVHRTSREHEPAVKQARARRDLQILDVAVPEQGPQPTLLNALGECHATLNNQPAAAQYYRQALRLSKPGSTEMLEAYYGLLTTFDDAQHDRRLATCLEALDRFPFDAQLLCAMGNYLQSQGRLDLSCRAYQSAVQLGQVNPEVWHLADVGAVAALCLGTIWSLQGQDDKAREVLREAAARLPDAARVRRSLIELDVKDGRVLEALGEAEKLPADFPHREAYRSAIRGGCQAARKNWIPAIAYLETAYDAGCRDTLCLRWLSMSLIASNRRDDAVPIIAEWQLLEPGSSEARQFFAALTEPTTTLPQVAGPAPLDAATLPVGAKGLAGAKLRIDHPQDVRESNLATPRSVESATHQPRR